MLFLELIAALVVLLWFFYSIFSGVLNSSIKVSFTGISLLPVFLLIYFYWGGISCGIRRMHDQGKSGWWYLLYGISIYVLLNACFRLTADLKGSWPILGLVLAYIARFALLYLFMLRKPTEGDNQFGKSIVYK